MRSGYAMPSKIVIATRRLTADLMLRTNMVAPQAQPPADRIMSISLIPGNGTMMPPSP